MKAQLEEGQHVDKDLIQAAAIITAELLRRSPTATMDATEDVIASAFETAYRGVKAGTEKVEKKPQKGARRPGDLVQKLA